MFENARVHDFWAIYQNDLWIDRDADGAHLSDDIWFMTTPGHTAQDMTTLVRTGDGVAALTHLWWDAAVRGRSTRSGSSDALHRNRAQGARGCQR